MSQTVCKMFGATRCKGCGLKATIQNGGGGGASVAITNDARNQFSSSDGLFAGREVHPNLTRQANSAAAHRLLSDW